VYVEGREIVLVSLPFRYVASLVTQTGTVIINTDPHTEKGSHWLAVHFFPKSSSAYYFDSYGILPLVPDIEAFIRRNCTVWIITRDNCKV
jgi:hypothetical protein